MTTAPATARPASPWGLLVSVAALDVGAMLPVALIGVFAEQVRDELDVSSGFIGISVGVFFLTGSLTAASAGMRIDAVGPRRIVVAAGTCSVVAQAVGSAARHPAMIVALCAVLGSCFALMMPATNAVLGARFPDRTRTLAVCVKQSAVPTSVLLAALSAPALAPLGGWGSGQVMSAAGLAVALVVFAVRHAGRLDAPVRTPSASGGGSAAARRRVLRVALATMLASCLAGSLTAYTAVSLGTSGASVATAAGVITAGNLLGIVVRVASGVMAQQRGSGSWLPVGAMMGSGGAGSWLIASGSPPAVAIGTLLAFGLGWGWTGLTYALVLEANRDDPGATGAALQAGGMFGSATGPFAMAGLISLVGLGGAWVAIGALSVLAGAVAAWPELARRGR